MSWSLEFLDGVEGGRVARLFKAAEAFETSVLKGDVPADDLDGLNDDDERAGRIVVGALPRADRVPSFCLLRQSDDTGAAEAEPAAAVPADVQAAAKKWKPRGGGLSG